MRTGDLNEEFPIPTEFDFILTLSMMIWQLDWLPVHFPLPTQQMKTERWDFPLSFLLFFELAETHKVRGAHGE